jgi:hypothetical protein
MNNNRFQWVSSDIVIIKKNSKKTSTLSKPKTSKNTDINKTKEQ